ncbi:outer membrane beta-barrel protein [Aquimarina gracilis]|uniref:Outer membrane beta-barrel protein n=1 Tax=Aquimarina gracilis TaxID=874422 RepID=A0ABU5ZTS6_9FLAO|nr:outer membrane beta-barrel protein [Aquimarina gracilis]MEB3345476.1 outer membrane beta-barrel protein [Aquimarina gracilis]
MKTYFAIAKLWLVLLLFSEVNVYAQQGWMLGIAPSLEMNEQLLGINGRIYYGPNDHFCFGPEVTFFPYQEINEEYELSLTELNLNTHYIFELTHKLGIYPLAGLNYSIEKERLINQNTQTKEENEFGLNYGFGAHYNLKKLFAFIEFKGVAGKLNDEFISAGVIFSIFRKTQKQPH